MKKRRYGLLLAAALLATGAIAITSLGAGRAAAQEDSAAKGPGVTAVWDSGSTGAEGTDAQTAGAAGTDAQTAGAAGTDAQTAGAAGTDAQTAGAAGTDAQTVGAAGTDAQTAGAAGTDAQTAGAAGTDAQTAGAAGTDAQTAGAAGTNAQDPEPPLPAVENGHIIPANLTGAKMADQLIVVVGTGGCNADVSYYKKDQEGGWNLVWKEAGIVGRNGITAEKREGDGKTPAGTYGLTMAFGLKEDPGAILPYHKIVKGDYWVDDSSSPHYNKLVNTSQIPKNWNSAENLAATSPYYNYALALDYNPQCVPGMGSAIFLHCFTAAPDRGSAGCIRLPEERAKELVQSVTAQTKIVIAPDLLQLH